MRGVTGLLWLHPGSGVFPESLEESVTCDPRPGQKVSLLLGIQVVLSDLVVSLSIPPLECSFCFKKILENENVNKFMPKFYNMHTFNTWVYFWFLLCVIYKIHDVGTQSVKFPPDFLVQLIYSIGNTMT